MGTKIKEAKAWGRQAGMQALWPQCTWHLASFLFLSTQLPWSISCPSLPFLGPCPPSGRQRVLGWDSGVLGVWWVIMSKVRAFKVPTSPDILIVHLDMFLWLVLATQHSNIPNAHTSFTLWIQELNTRPWNLALGWAIKRQWHTLICKMSRVVLTYFLLKVFPLGRKSWNYFLCLHTAGWAGSPEELSLEQPLLNSPTLAPE